MRILYSQLKEYIPSLTLTARETGDIFTMIGYMMDEYKEVEYKGAKDILLGLEVRQNRPDVVAIYGLVKELAAYLNVKHTIPTFQYELQQKNAPVVLVTAQKAVKRLLAIEMQNVQNNSSPIWMQEFLAFYDINSINLLVDISNYVMILTGIPLHIFDAENIHGKLNWTFNKTHTKMVTLNGTELPLTHETLVIEDEKNPLALTMIGGELARVTEKTKSILIETAIYDRIIVQKNARALSITTEASKRLEKILDSNYLPDVINLTISLIKEFCNGEISSTIFDFYPNQETAKPITFKASECSVYAGIAIANETAFEILHRLGFTINRQNADEALITPPVNRLDVELKEDLIEEVIRMVGFYSIPSDEIPALQVVPQITPKSVLLNEKVKDLTSQLGFDEILSWPMTGIEDNTMQNYSDWQVIITQNAVNEEVPSLRQTLSIGLVQQLDSFLKNNVTHIKIFEVGRVFGKVNNSYLEHESLGILFHTDDSKPALSLFKTDIETILRTLGLTNLKFCETKKEIGIANPFAKWEIFINDHSLGVLYKLLPDGQKGNTYFAEMNLTELLPEIEKSASQSIIELTQKLVILDTNVELQASESIYEYLEALQQKIEKDHLWSLEIVDVYQLVNKTRYTIRVTYFNFSDTEAKLYDEKIFGTMKV